MANSYDDMIHDTYNFWDCFFLYTSFLLFLQQSLTRQLAPPLLVHALCLRLSFGSSFQPFPHILCVNPLFFRPLFPVLVHVLLGPRVQQSASAQMLARHSVPRTFLLFLAIVQKVANFSSAPFARPTQNCFCRYGYVPMLPQTAGSSLSHSNPRSMSHPNRSSCSAVHDFESSFGPRQDPRGSSTISWVASSTKSFRTSASHTVPDAASLQVSNFLQAQGGLNPSSALPDGGHSSRISRSFPSFQPL